MKLILLGSPALMAALTGAALTLLAVPPAPAASGMDLFAGRCELDVTFSFSPALTKEGVSSYSFSWVSSGSSCVNAGDVLGSSPFGTNGGGGGTLPLAAATCGTFNGSGTFWQGFDNGWPNVTGGRHALTGTWLGAQMVLHGNPFASPTFGAVVVLTPRLNEPTANASKLAGCATTGPPLNGSSVSSVKMRGVQVLADP